MTSEKELDNVKIFTGTLKSISDREYTDNFVTLISFKQALKNARKELIEEIIGKAISIRNEEDLWNEEIEDFTRITLLTKDWNKLKEKKQ